jgi:imidazolonepropionase-like amidohydrolase
LFDAQQAHYYGFPENLALGAVTTQPAQVVGLDYRIGYIREGEYFGFHDSFSL